MNKKVLGIVLLILLANFAKAQLYLNELSQGPSGQVKEYVEFVVVGTPGCDAFTTFDLRGWIFDDNSGIFLTGGSAGVSNGCFRFSNDPIWSTVKIGTIILIYDNANKNALIPADNLTGTNCQFVIPISNTQLINSSSTTPSTAAQFSNVSNYSTVVFNSASNTWNTMNNGGDSYCTISPSLSLTTAVSWGNNSSSMVNFSGTNASGLVMMMTNATNNDPTLQSNWNALPIAGNETPGTANNAANAAWLNSIGNNCLPHAVLSSTANSTPTACPGSCNGSGSIVAADGYGGYTYSWNTTPVQTTNNVNGLCAGIYTVTITDTNNCQLTDTITITSPDSISATSEVTDAVCTNNNGSIVVHVSGGTAPYAFSWNTTPALTDSVAGNLLPGNYTVTVTDAELCNKSFTYTVQQVDSVLTVTSVINDVLCNGGNSGSVSINIDNGSPSYSVNWNTTPVQTGSTATNLSAGNYTAAITDANGCQTTVTLTINEPPVLSVNTTFTDVLCNGGNDGTATATSSGGTPPYAYSWNTTPVQTTSVATGLSAGSYTVTVSDSNNCTQTSTVTISEPAAVTASVQTTNEICAQGNGSAIINASGGSGPYTYAWTPNISTDSVSNILSAGTYIIIIADQNSCLSTINFTIADTGYFTLNASLVNNSSCAGADDAAATVSINGGQANFAYNWAPSGATTDTAYNLSPGIHTVTVTDANGCAASDTVQTNEPAAITLNLNTTNISCNGGNDGTATAIVSGGTPGYSYLWDNFNTTATNSSLSAGNYIVFVWDANNCSDSSTITITEPLPINVSGTTQNSSCFGSNNASVSVSVNGGTGSYTYNWSNTATSAVINNLSPGTYTVIVSDQNNCTDTTSYAVSEPADLNLTLTNNPSTCNDNGSATVQISGGTTPYSYSWNSTPAQTTVTATNLAPASYTVTVTDSNNCVKTGSTTVIYLPSLQMSLSILQNVTCNGGNDGSIKANTSGSNAPFNYTWIPVLPNDSIVNNLPAGFYTATVTDAAGCAVQDTITLIDPPAITLVASNDQQICDGASATISAQASGGAGGPFQYNWNTGLTGSGPHTVNPATNTDYIVTANDANGCMSDDDTVTVTVLPPLTVQITNTGNNSICQGSSTILVANAGGGNSSSYTYSWTPTGGANAANTVSPNTTTTYTVTANDGCSTPAQSNITITVLPLPVVSFSSDVQGGCPPLTVNFINTSSASVSCSWQLGDGNTSNFCQPNYTYTDNGTFDVTLSITNSDGCSNSATIDSFIVVSPAPIADFSTNTNETTLLEPLINFYDQSENAEIWSWYIDSVLFTDQQNFNYMFADTGSHFVTLFVSNRSGCTDTALKKIKIKEFYGFYIPNAFTPDENLKNDKFLYKHSGLIQEDFEFSIFDRWGTLVFKTNTIDEGWDGKNGGLDCPTGVYIYKIHCRDNKRQIYDYMGIVTLIK